MKKIQNYCVSIIKVFLSKKSIFFKVCHTTYGWEVGHSHEPPIIVHLTWLVIWIFHSLKILWQNYFLVCSNFRSLYGCKGGKGVRVDVYSWNYFNHEKGYSYFSWIFCFLFLFAIFLHCKVMSNYFLIPLCIIVTKFQIWLLYIP